jgi:hypothetical protein
MRPLRRRIGRANGRQRGYVLLMVITTLAVIAFVALRFAERIDLLRGNALGLRDYAAARVSASGAQAATLYWLATRPVMPTGHGDALGALHEDGRLYRLGNGALVSVQDQRGLLSVNALNRAALLNLLIQDGVEPVRAQAWMDVLEDYIDTDSLKRLNGAEPPEYAALGLAAPRNDWLLSLRELDHMPLWRDDPERLVRLSRRLSVAISNQFNPNTASPEVLRAIFPSAAPEQLDLLLTLRKGGLLSSGGIAARATGLAMDREDYWFLPGFETRITVWAPGLPRAIEYNARLTPAGMVGPWVFTEKHNARRPSQSNEPSAALPFPLALAASGPSFPASAAAR